MANHSPNPDATPNATPGDRADAKRALRRRLRATLDSIGPPRLSVHAERIARHLLDDPGLGDAVAVLAYASFSGELSLDPFIRGALARGQRVAIPEIDWERKSMVPREISSLDGDLVLGRYDIRVPVARCPRLPDETIGAILVPALAFDPSGNRLGRGAGFYDRFVGSLRERGHRPTLIGVCHHAQVTGSVPTEPHDMRVDRVITERGPLAPA